MENRKLGKRCVRFFAFTLLYAVQIQLASCLAISSDELNACDKIILSNIKVNCEETYVEIISPDYSTKQEFLGNLGDLRLILENYLQIESFSSGATQSTSNALIDLNTGKQKINMSGGNIYDDENYVVYRATGVVGDRWTYSPTIYIYRKGDSDIIEREYMLYPRINCGRPDIDLYATIEDVKVMQSEIIFYREDKCGKFNVVKSWRQSWIICPERHLWFHQQ